MGNDAQLAEANRVAAAAPGIWAFLWWPINPVN